MLITLVCVYIAVWTCALWAGQRAGRLRFLMIYAVACLVVPNVFGFGFWCLYKRVDPANASDLTATIVLLGIVLGAVAYPISYVRTRRGGGTGTP